ncbi:MAG: hypothetical protein JXR51_13935, partial [Bacteroidales bacterium]|nr:hypothetical protein [Bacteroidales bacterium]
MKKIFFLACIIGMSYSTSAQLKVDRENALEEGIHVFQGQMEIKSNGRSFSFAFAKGDRVLLKLSTEKDKEIRSANLTSVNGGRIWGKESVSNFSEEIVISNEDVYTLTIIGKGLGGRTVSLEIIRKPGSQADFNTAWMKYNTYTTQEVKYAVDSVIGYKAPIISQKDIRVFNKYLYQNISLYDDRFQVKGNLAIDGNHVKAYPMQIDPTKVPKDAKFKCYTYSMNAVLGGQQHWQIAELCGQVGGALASVFLSPAAGFAVNGAMALIGPPPNKAPVMYYMSNRQSDIKTVGEIKSNENKAKNVANTVTKGVSTVVSIFNKDAGKSVENSTKLDRKTEADLDFNQKGNVTNLFVTSALPPKAKYFIMTNSYL